MFHCRLERGAVNMETSSMLFIALIVSCLAAQTLADPIAQAAKDTRVIFGEEKFLNVSNHFITHMEPDLYGEPGYILFSWGSAIKTTVYGDRPQPVVGSMDTYGFADGDASVARFNAISNFMQIAKDVLLIVDRYNGCIRHFNRTSQITSPYVGKCTSRGYADGVGTNAQFYNPSDILLDERDNKNLIVVDDVNNAIRAVNVTTKEVSLLIQDESVIERPRFALFDNDDKNILYLTLKFRVAKITLSDKNITILAGTILPGGPFPDGTLSTGVLGYFTAEMVQLNPTTLLVADLWNHEVRVLDFAHNRFTSMCQPRVNDSLIHPVGCEMMFVHSLLLHNDTLYVGEMDGIHMIPIDSIPINGVDHFVVDKCNSRKIVVALQPGERLAKLEIEEGITLLLERGHHQYVATEKGFDCIIHIVVKDADIQRRVEFQVDYSFSCVSLQRQVTKNLVDSMTENNFVSLLEVCDGMCTRKQNSKPVQQCVNDVLTVIYSTDLTYGADVTSIPQNIKDKLTTRLINKGTIMSIADPQAIPPVVFPQRLADGSSAKILFTTSCLGGKTYDSAADSCM